MAEASRARRTKGRPDDGLFDRELDHLPPEARWREWMNRVEATIFAASEPVDRETLARIVGKNCSIDLLIDDIREELRGRPYDLVAVAGGWKHLTRPAYADAIRRAVGGSERAVDLSADIGRRADRLIAVAPGLRARGADVVVDRFLSDDAIVASAKTAGMSDRSLRRLFERLLKLGAVRELSGRAAFRIYGI